MTEQKDHRHIVYIRLRKKVRTPKNSSLQLRQVAQLIADPELEEQLLNLPIHEALSRRGGYIIVDIMQIVHKLKTKYPYLQIEHFGEPHTLIEFTGPAKSPSRLIILFVWLLLFIGSGLAIMNFHADVSMSTVHQRIYELITGLRVEHPYMLQIPYSFGIGAGMILFFNHLFKKKINEEPSPLEMELFTYQENVHQYVIAEEYEKRQLEEKH